MAMENLMDLINYEHSVSCSQLADEYRYRQLALSALDENHLGSNAAWVELRAWHNAERRQLSELHRKEIMKNPPMEAQAFAKWLNNEGACRESLKWQRGKTLRETWNTCHRGDWLKWLLNTCGYRWTAPARAEYQRVKADTIRTLIPYPLKQPTAEML